MNLLFLSITTQCCYPYFCKSSSSSGRGLIQYDYRSGGRYSVVAIDQIIQLILFFRNRILTVSCLKSIFDEQSYFQWRSYFVSAFRSFRYLYFRVSNLVLSKAVSFIDSSYYFYNLATVYNKNAFSALTSITSDLIFDYIFCYSLVTSFLPSNSIFLTLVLLVRAASRKYEMVTYPALLILILR